MHVLFFFYDRKPDCRHDTVEKMFLKIAYVQIVRKRVNSHLYKMFLKFCYSSCFFFQVLLAYVLRRGIP